MIKVWRLLDTGVRTAAENIALDETLLESRSRGKSPNTVRFLRFSPPAVLVGYHQSVAQEVRKDYCQNHGIDINRRITGGGAILCDESQIGWELIASKVELGIGKIALPLFKKICQATVAGLRKFGVDARFRPKNDIEVNGKKISGTGGTEDDGAFLFQGTLLMDFDIATMLKALRIPLEKLRDKEIQTAKERITCLKWELGYLPVYGQVVAALKKGFEETFGIKLVAAALNEYEKTLFEEKIRKFQSEEWIHQTRGAIGQQQVLRSVYKTPGGLIRISLVYNIREKRVKSTFISGDFFAFPQRTIPDLEARLKDVRANKIDEIVTEFFNCNKPHIPGVKVEDFLFAIKQALAKADYLQFGIPLSDVNHIFTVNGSFEEIALRPISLLLLPYCAKFSSCEYRYTKECTLCGGCSVGEVYRWGREKGLRTETIVNYEDLETTLTQARKAGAEAFIGSCCEAFYVKHKGDFERIGLPGVLVDVNSSTCYDLGEQEKALQGQFENQTELKLELLKKILDVAKITSSCT